MQKHKVLKRILLAALLLLLALAIALGAAVLRAKALLNRALDGHRIRPQAEQQMTEFSLLAEMRMVQASTRVGGFLSVVSPEQVSLRTDRGTLFAQLYAPVAGDGDGAPWALVLHGGLGTSGAQMQDVACELSLAGYNVLLAELYAHGQSDGKVSTLGIGDAQDVLAWADWIVARDADASIALVGQDEGALAILLAASGMPGKGLSGAVKAAALDSVYTDVRARCRAYLSEIGEDNAIDALLFDAALALTGNDLTSEDVLERAAMCELPLLLIHGTFDSEVPAWQAEDVAHAAKDAQLLPVEGAAHGMARYVEPDAYCGALIGFLNRHLRGEE